MTTLDYPTIGMVRAVFKHLNFSYKGLNTLIETGTHRGGGAALASEVFNKVYTIELSQELYEYSKAYYSSNNKIEFIQGNAPERLSELMSRISTPYVLFLDAHGSGGDTVYHENYGRYGTPILEELQAVKYNLPDIIIIDDYKHYESINAPAFVEQYLGVYDQWLIQETPNWNLVFKRK